jgi:hypothetical protein
MKSHNSGAKSSLHQTQARLCEKLCMAYARCIEQQQAVLMSNVCLKFVLAAQCALCCCR